MPRYWPTWLGIAVLYSLSWLPYRLQKGLAWGLGHLIFALARSRKRVIERNIELCFPDMSDAERRAILRGNRFSLGMAMLETSMGWWWPTWRIKGMAEVEGYEHVQAILDKGKGVLGVAIHNMSLEVLGRVCGLHKPAVGFYRRHNNPLMEYMQFHGRNRSNKNMIHKKDVRGMIQALNEGELCLYLPDQDYGRRRAEFVPFFAVPDAATTTGTLLFAKEANCEMVFVLPLRTEKGYKLKFIPGLENIPSGDDKEDVRRINQQIEQMVMVAPEQYLWAHKRFKTRPDEKAPSYYQA